MNCRTQTKLAILLAMIAMLLGCGGGGTPNVSPTLTINWPARSRDVTAPSSAVSVYITLSNNDTATIDRGNTSTAFSQTYVLPVSISPGTYGVQLQFCSLEDGGGGVVGNAAGTATISSSSLSLGTFSTAGTVANVAVLPGQQIPVGSTVALNAAAYDTVPEDLAVAPGGIFWNVVTTDGSMTVTTDGHVTATAVGSISVTATIDGVVSPVQTITSYTAGAVSGCTNSTYTPNYASEMENSTDPTYSGTLRHWTSFPVTVAIVQNQYLNANFNSMATQALANWTSATNGNATFQIVSATANPDVTITFQPSSTIDNSDDGVVGLTTVYPSATNGNVLAHADIQVATDLSSDASTLNCVTHELGHSIGIGGHSDVAQNLMYPYLNDSFDPATNDVNTLFTAYCGSFPQTNGLTRSVRPARSSKPVVIIDHRPKS